MNRIRLVHGNGAEEQEPEGTRSLILSYGNELFAAHRLHRCQVSPTPILLRLQIMCMTAEFGQKLIIGLLGSEQLSHPGNRGIVVSIDPETGAVEDLHNDAGIIGYAPGLPMEPGVHVGLALEAWFYGQVVIPRLWIGEESVLHPALLMDRAPHLTAVAGGEITDGAMPRFDATELLLQPLETPMPMHG